ncbi:MAG: hypothetical protein DRP01_01920 [Archaeoglobales archaeon]|nr:MAG: hypothetical protein DRP01_01920 [Archaeoglobales archaeon]
MERLDRISKLLDRLAEEDFTLENIVDNSDLELLLGTRELVEAETATRSRYLKYITKRGDVLYPPAREALYKALRERAYLDAILKAALDFLGICGPHKLDYHRFAYKLAKRLKGMRVERWPQILEEFTIWWERPVKLDPKAAKVITILTAKVLYQLHYGKLRLEKIPHEILYPEVKHGGEERAVQGGSGEG